MLNELVAKKLSDIVEEYGIELIDDPRRCGGLLRDYCGEHKREINLLLLAQREGVPQELLSSAATMPEAIVVARLAKRLHEDHGCAEDFARWAVASWVKALGSRIGFPVPVVQQVPAVPKSPVVTATPVLHAPVAQNQSSSQTATPLDGGLKQLLFKVAGTWVEPAAWPGLWKQISVNAVKQGLDERTVRRRMKVLWDEIEPDVMERKRREEEERLEKERVEEERRKAEEKKRLEAEAYKNRHIPLLAKWLKERPNGLWNYSQWDDFVDTLDSSADVAFLEKVRDDIYIDPQTGLIWARNGNIAGKKMTWDEAMNWVKNLNYAGFSDWRLPKKDDFYELGTGRPDEWFDANGFNTNTEAYHWWSSTTDAEFPDIALFVVGFGDDGFEEDLKSGSHYVRCVRGGELII